MREESKRSWRVPVRRDDIVGRIRNDIVTGVYAPGQRLPPRTWFEEHFQTTPVTIQRAFQVLLDESVIHSNGRHGTFVNERPPHLARYALLLYGNPEAPNYFCATLLRAAREVQKTRNIQLECSFVLDSGDEGYALLQRLCYEVEHHLYAGLIFAANPFRVAHTPLMTHPGIPRIACMSEQRYEQCMIYFPDEAVLFREAMLHLAGLGKKDIAAIFPGLAERRRKLAHFQEFGITCRPEHLHFISSPTSSQAESLVRLLWAPDRSRPPEAIFCGDDNLLPGVISGLRLVLGDRAAEIPIVSHANFPLGTEHELPVRYFGYDLVAFLEESLRLIDQRRMGGETLPRPFPVTTLLGSH